MFRSLKHSVLYSNQQTKTATRVWLFLKGE